MKKQTATLLTWLAFVVCIIAALVVGSVLVGDDPSDGLPTGKKDQRLEKLKREVELRERITSDLPKKEWTEAELKSIRQRAAAAGVELPERFKAKRSDSLVPRSLTGAPGTEFGAGLNGLSADVPFGVMTPAARESAMRILESRFRAITINELNFKRSLLVPAGEFAAGSQPGFELLLRHFKRLAEEGTISADALSLLESGEIEIIYDHAEGDAELQVAEIRESEPPE